MDSADSTVAMDICSSDERIVPGQRVLIYPVPKFRIALWIVIWLMGAAVDVLSPGASVIHSSWVPWLQATSTTLLFWVMSVSIVSQRPRLGVFGRQDDASFIDLSSGDRIQVNGLSGMSENGRAILSGVQLLGSTLAAVLAFFAVRSWSTAGQEPLLITWPLGLLAWVVALAWFRRTRFVVRGMLRGRTQRFRMRMEPVRSRQIRLGHRG